MHARYEIAIGAEHIKHRAAHAGHFLHIHGNIGAVGKLNANVGNR